MLPFSLTVAHIVALATFAAGALALVVNWKIANDNDALRAEISSLHEALGKLKRNHDALWKEHTDRRDRYAELAHEYFILERNLGDLRQKSPENPQETPQET